MNLGDYLVRAISNDGFVRAFSIVTTQLVEEARTRHDTFPVATAALGRCLTAALMMSAGLKNEEILTLRVLGDGPLGAIVATAEADGTVRGYVQNPAVDLPPTAQGKLDVGGAVGKNGCLVVSKDLGLKEPYSSSVPLVSGEIGDDLAQYFLQSEQCPSAVGLGVLVERNWKVKAAGGFLLQLLPGAPAALTGELDANLQRIASVTQLVERGLSPEEILGKVLQGIGFKVLETKPVFFRCRCSKENIESILLSLGKEEIEEMITEQGEAEVRCHFCNELYHLNHKELERLLSESK